MIRAGIGEASKPLESGRVGRERQSGAGGSQQESLGWEWGPGSSCLGFWTGLPGTGC